LESHYNNIWREFVLANQSLANWSCVNKVVGFVTNLRVGLIDLEGYWTWTGNVSKYDGVLREPWDRDGVIRYDVLSELRPRQGLWMGKQKWVFRFVCSEKECVKSVLLENASRNYQV